MLTPDQLKAREGRLTASMVAPLMTGDEQKLMDLWRLMVGDPDYVPENLDNVWPVQLGSETEPLNLRWFALKQGGEVTRRGEVVIGNPEWMACTLDGWSTQHNCPVEAKHVGGFEPFETIVQRYHPQMHWIMMVTGAKTCAISVIEGGREPRVEIIQFDSGYAEQLMTRAKQFMVCVETLTPPIAPKPVAAPIVPETVYDFTGKNEWAAQAATWLENKDAKKKCEAAEKTLRSLVPADAARCHGHNVEIKRSKSGSLLLKELKQ